MPSFSFWNNNTAKARTIIDAFSAKNIVRVSATAEKNKRYEFFEIDELDVIDAGLITKALYVNEGISDTKYNYCDYLITKPVNYGEELKRLPGADYDLCCALFSMIPREDHFNSGAYAKRNEAEVVLSVLDRMLVLLSDNKWIYLYEAAPIVASFSFYVTSPFV